MSVSPGQNGTSPSSRSSTSSSSRRPTSTVASAVGSAPSRTRVAASSNSLIASLATVGEVLLVLLGRRGERRVGVELRLHLLPRLRALGRDVLGGPVALVRPVALQHIAGDG